MAVRHASAPCVLDHAHHSAAGVMEPARRPVSYPPVRKPMTGCSSIAFGATPV
jgi:hypothetical protein